MNGRDLTKKLEGKNTLYLRRDNPISSLDVKKVRTSKKWNSQKNQRHVVAMSLDSKKILNEYLHYLFSRSVSRYMLDTVTKGSVISFIMKNKLLSMPLLVPPISVQEAVLAIRKAIDNKEGELRELKDMLDDLDDHERVLRITRDLVDVDNIEGLLYQEESSRLEFKSSLWTNFVDGVPIETQEKKSVRLEDSCIKTICAFLNSEGGVLLIGVSDEKSSDGKSTVTGIEADYQWCKQNNQNVDGFGQGIEAIIRDKLSSELTELTKHISKSFHEIEGKTICRIDVTPAPTIGVHGYRVMAKLSSMNDKRMCIRSGETTTVLSPESQTNYIMSHFIGTDSE